MHEVSIDRLRCVGCGLCEETLPEVFQVDHVAADVIVSGVDGALIAEVAAVMHDCPVAAICVRPLLHPAADDDDQECDREEEHRNIRQYQREHRYAPNGHLVQPHHAERLQR
ncbi:MAG: ferredoxin [Spirochaetaceae bacterium]|nr:MAG: ferredoxin [Spirochaetaceae bacterium]